MKTRVGVVFSVGLLCGVIVSILLMNRYEHESSGPSGVLMWRHDRLTGRSYLSRLGGVWETVERQAKPPEKKAPVQANTTLLFRVSDGSMYDIPVNKLEGFFGAMREEGLKVEYVTEESK